MRDKHENLLDWRGKKKKVRRQHIIDIKYKNKIGVLEKETKIFDRENNKYIILINSAKWKVKF